jgi:hypothetical protein
VKSRKIAIFAAGRNRNRAPFTIPALNIARRYENEPGIRHREAALAAVAIQQRLPPRLNVQLWIASLRSQ